MGALLAILGILGAFTAAKLSYQSNQQTNQFNQDIAHETNQTNVGLAGQANTWSLEQWAREMAYNTPSAQMRRFRQAGLNPSLMYGSGTGILNEAPQSPDVSSAVGSLVTPRMMPTDFSSLSNAFNESAQSALASAEARLNNAKADEIEQKLPHEVQVLKDTSEQLRAEIDSINQSVQESARRIQSMDIEDQLKAAQKVRIEFQSDLDNMNFDLAKKEFEQNVKESNSRIHLNAAQRSNFESITRISNREYREMLATWKARLEGFDLENERIRQAIDLNKEDISNAIKNGELLGFQIDAGRISNVLDQEQYDDLSGKNGLYHYYKTKLNLKLSRDLKSLGDSGRLLFRVGK